MKATALPPAVYVRATEPDELPRELRLRAVEWAVYFAVDGSCTTAEIARRLRVDDDQCVAAITRLINFSLVIERELNAGEYVRALAASGDQQEKTLREFLSGAVAAPATAAVEPAIAPPPIATPRPRPLLPFKPLPRPDEAKEIPPMTSQRKLSLRALMQLIEQRAGSQEAGQLDIYRVFIRVDTKLLRRNGIETLRFREDRLVDDPELQRAIVGSIKKTLDLDCPESVWVAA